MAKISAIRIILISIAMAVVAGYRAGRSVAETEPWMRITTRNFTLIGNANIKDMNRVAWRLEQFRAAVLRLLHGREGQSAPITVVVFRNEESYRPFKPLYQGQPSTVSGYFQASDDKSYITLAINRRDTDLYAIIFHEYVHVLQWEQVDESHYVSGFTGESIPKMRQAFKRAIDLNPNFSDSYKQLAFMHLALNENLDQAVTLLKKSLELAPDREDFAYTLALETGNCQLETFIFTPS